MEERTESAVCRNPIAIPCLSRTLLISPSSPPADARLPAAPSREQTARAKRATADPQRDVRLPEQRQISALDAPAVRHQAASVQQRYAVERAIMVLLIADQTTVSQALPDPKARKTLMERAGEFPSKPSVIATPAPRTANKGVSLASQTGVSSAARLESQTTSFFQRVFDPDYDCLYLGAVPRATPPSPIYFSPNHHRPSPR